MNAATIPSPALLTGDVMLPFALWPVAECVNGEYDVNAIAAKLGWTAAAVQSALEAIERELGASLTNVEAASIMEASSSTAAFDLDSFLDALTLATMETIGPVGEVIVEEALEEARDHPAPMSLIAYVVQDLREPQRSAFLGRLRTKGLL